MRYQWIQTLIQNLKLDQENVGERGGGECFLDGGITIEINTHKIIKFCTVGSFAKKRDIKGRQK